MTILRVSTAPLGKKEPGGTRDVTTQIQVNIRRVNPVANSVLVPFDFYNET